MASRVDRVRGGRGGGSSYAVDVPSVASRRWLFRVSLFVHQSVGRYGRAARRSAVGRRATARRARARDARAGADASSAANVDGRRRARESRDARGATTDDAAASDDGCG